MILGWCRDSKRWWLLDKDVLLRRRCLYFADATEIHLTPREVLIMELLMMRRGQVVTYQDFTDYIYSENSDGLLDPWKTVSAYVWRLRQKLDGRLTIEARWGLGYELR